MTESDLKASMAAIRASLTHLEKSMDRADSERGETSKTIDDIRERVVRLEMSGTQGADLPSRVAHTEQQNAVQDAIRIERQEVLSDIRRVVFSAIGAVAAIVSIIGGVVVLMTGI